MIALRDLDELLGRRRVNEPDPELEALRPRMRAAAGLGALPSLSSALSGAVRGVRFRSNVTPPVTWDPNAPAAPPSGGSSFADLGPVLQPALDVELATGQTLTVAPYGEPTGDYRVLVAGAAVAVAGTIAGAGLIGYALGRRSRRRS